MTKNDPRAPPKPRMTSEGPPRATLDDFHWFFWYFLGFQNDPKNFKKCLKWRSGFRCVFCEVSGRVLGLKNIEKSSKIAPRTRSGVNGRNTTKRYKGHRNSLRGVPRNDQKVIKKRIPQQSLISEHFSLILHHFWVYFGHKKHLRGALRTTSVCGSYGTCLQVIQNRRELPQKKCLNRCA